MAKTKTTSSDDVIEGHPLVLQALEGVEEAKARLEATERDIVRGMPVAPADLADAQAGVRHAELLVERARNEAERDIADQDRAEAVAERIRQAVAAGDDDAYAAAVTAQRAIVKAVVDMWAPAEANTTRVAQLANEIHALGDAGRFGLATAQGPGVDRHTGVRTNEAVLAATPPLGILAAAVLEVLDRQQIDSGFPPAARAGLKALAKSWASAQEFHEPPHRPIRSAADAARARERAATARRRAAVERDRQRREEAEERYYQERTQR